MKEKRKFKRFATDFDATYVDSMSGKEHRCKISEISRQGTKILLYTQEKIEIGSRLRIDIPQQSGITSIKCIVRVLWGMKLKENDSYRFLCGGIFDIIRNQDRWQLLDAAFENWKTHEEQKAHASFHFQPLPPSHSQT